jgi:Tfp pilus assembly protein PilV
MLKSGGSRGSGGFTFVELVVAMTMLLFVVLGSALASARLLHASADAEIEAKVLQALEDHVAKIRMDSNYGELETNYEGTQSGLTGLPGFTRTTTVTHTEATSSSGGTIDYKTIDVAVSGPFQGSPLTRRIVVAAP